MSRARRRADSDGDLSVAGTTSGVCPHGDIHVLVDDIEREGIPCAWPLLSRGSADCDEAVVELIVYEGTITPIAPAMFVIPTCSTHADAVRRWASSRTVAAKALLTMQRSELATLLEQFHSGEDPLCQELPLRVALAPRSPSA